MQGAALGAADGAADGALEGAADGALDGAADGAADGGADWLDVGTYVAAGGSDCWSADTLAVIVTPLPKNALRSGITNPNGFVIVTRIRTLPCGFVGQVTVTPANVSQVTEMFDAPIVLPEP